MCHMYIVDCVSSDKIMQRKKINKIVLFLLNNFYQDGVKWHFRILVWEF